MSPDVIYKVSVISSISTYEVLSLVISFLGLAVSTILSIILYKLTNRIGTQQEKLQAHALKIELFDKRMSIYEALNELCSTLLYAQYLLNTKEPNNKLFKEIYLEFNKWDEKHNPKSKFTLCKSIFNEELAKKIQLIFTEFKSINCPITYVFDKELSEDDAKEAKNILLKSFSHFNNNFHTYDIFNEIKPYLDITIKENDD